jgi:predicted ATP-grasp superfamily ATP-dependent carboligase
VKVVGLAFDLEHPCARTRVCERIVTAPRDGARLVATLAELGPTLGAPAVLYPCTDETVLQIARHRDRLETWYRIPIAPTETLEDLADKSGFVRCARAAGVPVPPTFVLRSSVDARQAAASLTFPCILKPDRRTARWLRHVGAKVMRVERREDLMGTYDRCAPFADSLVVQQWIEGDDGQLFSCNCYFDRDGEPLVTFVARKVRQWPPRMGVSSLGVECRNDVVLDLTLRLFRAARFHGLAYLEVKRDARTGEHFAIEANVGRPTGRSAIAEAGGVELLYTMYCDALGLPLPTGRQQRYGSAKWIYWRQDLRSAFYYWRAGELSLREWARSYRGKKATAVFSWNDPRPFLVDLVKAAARPRRRRIESAEPEVMPSATPVAADTPTASAAR